MIRAYEVGFAVCTVELDKLPSKARPRFANGRAYTTRATKHAEALIRKAWIEQVGHSILVMNDECELVDMDLPTFTGEVRMQIEIQRPLPKSTSKTQVGKPDTKRPDLDNVQKLVCDALNKVAYKDDAQITRCTAHKLPLCEHTDHVRVTVYVEYYKEGRA